MENKKLNAFADKVSKIITAESKKIAETEKQLLAAESQKAETEKALTEAFDGGNTERYTELKKQIETISDTISIYSNLLAEIKEKPLITESEYKNNIAEVRAIVNESITEAESTYIKCIDTLTEAFNKLAADVNKGNSILHDLQYNLRKDDASVSVANGNRVKLPYLEESFTNKPIPISNEIIRILKHDSVARFRNKVANK